MRSLRAPAWAIALLSLATIAGLFAAPTTEKPVVKYLHIKSAVKSRYAKTLVTSKIMNPAGAAQEVNYEVTVPESAFISNFTMLVDGKIMDGLVRERKAAKREYHSARQSGQTAGHVATATVRDSNQVRISVNVAAQSKVTFNLTYEELLVRVKGRYELAINVNPGQVVDKLQIEVSIDEKRNITVLQVPEFRTMNEIDFEERDGISPYVTTNVSDHNVLIQYAPSKSEQERVGRNNGLQGKFVVRYDVERKDQPLNEILTKDGYFVHFFSPPEVHPLPKHVVFVLDVSGSMGGTKLRQLKEAMNAILNELNPEDYFNLIEFSSNAKILDLDNPFISVLIQSYSRHSVPAEVKSYLANAENIRRAKDAVNLMIASGGTNIYDALNAAIEVTKRAAHLVDPSPIIIFLTDGEATVGETNVDVISNLVAADRQHYVPVFSLAFGDDADLKFLKRISLRSGAFARKIYEAADAALQLRDFYRLVASPLLKNVTFSYDNDTVNGSELTKQRFNLMFSGSEFVVAGKLRSRTKKVTGVVNSSQGNYLMLPTPEVAPEPQPALVKEDDDNFLERLWAFLSIKQQLNKYEAWGASTDVREGEQKTPAQIAKEEALKLALQFSFVTPLTSLVVVERKEGEGETKIPEISIFDGPVSNGPVGSYNSGHRAGLMPAPAYRRPVFDHSHAFQSRPQPTQYMSHGVLSSEESVSNLAEAADFSLSSRIIAHPPPSASDFSIGLRRRSKPRTRIGHNPTSTPSLYGHSTTTPASTTVSTNGGIRFSDISWIDEMRGLANATNYKVFSLKNETGSVKILNYNESANITGGACSNQSSTCRPFKKCILEVFENWDNPEIFIGDYKCDINYQGDVFLGVCCPTNADHK